MLKLLFKFKKKLEEKGFTLVELLAVIVILAIIMLIAIPAVLNSVDSARRKTFSEYVTKTAGLAQQKYAESLITETSFGGNCIIYDITTDLGTSNSGEYKGYVLLNTITNDIYVTLSDDSYGITAYHFNDSKKELVSNLSPIGSIEEDKLTKEYLCSNSNCNSCSYKEGGIDKGIIADKESNEDAKEKYALMVTGQQLNISIRRLFNPNISVINQPFNDVKEFLYNDTLKDTEDKIDVSTPESKYRIWIWRIESRVYYYTDAPNGIYLNADSSHMFTNLMSLNITLTIFLFNWLKLNASESFPFFCLRVIYLYNFSRTAYSYTVTRQIPSHNTICPNNATISNLGPSKYYNIFSNPNIVTYHYRFRHEVSPVRWHLGTILAFTFI